jgi:hypothetical protein
MKGGGDRSDRRRSAQRSRELFWIASQVLCVRSSCDEPSNGIELRLLIRCQQRTICDVVLSMIAFIFCIAS